MKQNKATVAVLFAAVFLYIFKDGRREKRYCLTVNKV